MSHQQPAPTATIDSLPQRIAMSAQVDVLDRVKKLVLIDGWDCMTIAQTADYYGVSRKAVEHITLRHRAELDDAGYMVARGEEMHRLKSAHPQAGGASTLSLLPRRAILLVGMLLTDSPVAATVRRYLLDAEQVAVKSVEQPSTELVDWTDPLAVAMHQIKAQMAERAARLALEARTNVIEKKIEAIEGSYNSFTCLAYAKLHDLPTDRPYLARLGGYCTRITMRLGRKLVKRQDATFGEVGVYEVDVFEEALAAMARKDDK